MATITQQFGSPLPAPELYRMTLDEYERLAAAGILTDPRVELIDGYLVRKMTKNPPHVIATEELRKRLEPLIPAGWHVREEKPVRIPDHDEPEPDLAVARGRIRDYLHRHPIPAEIALLVEVAESTLARDQGTKLSVYATAEIPQYWIVNLEARQIEVYTQPDVATGRYRSCQVLGSGDVIELRLGTGDRVGELLGRIAVADVLP
jgi:Uma2 family endonuclease